MTFSIQDEVASRLMRDVSNRDRSRFVSRAVADHLRKQEAELVRACKAANELADVAEIEQELDRLEDEIEEPWDAAPAR